MQRGARPCPVDLDSSPGSFIYCGTLGQSISLSVSVIFSEHLKSAS